MKTVGQLAGVEQRQTEISMVTVYDSSSAKQVRATGADMILVEDSFGVTVLGYEDTVQVTLADMIHHDCTVRRDIPDTFVVVGMSIDIAGISMTQDLNYTLKLYQEMNANAVEVEGAHVTSFIEKAMTTGIPVVAHLELTLQGVGVMGYKLQGATKEVAEQLILDAKDVGKVGAVALVFKTIPNSLTKEINRHLATPAIGVDAGRGTGGQVLIYHGMLNYGIKRKTEFVKQLADFSVGVGGLRQYDQEAKSGVPPSEEYTCGKKVTSEINSGD